MMKIGQILNKMIKINKNMGRIRLSEDKLRQIVKESVTKILNELDWKTYANAAYKSWTGTKNDNFDRVERFQKAAADAFNRDYGYSNGDEYYGIDDDGILPVIIDKEWGTPEPEEMNFDKSYWDINPERYKKSQHISPSSTNGKEGTTHTRYKNSPGYRDAIPRSYSKDLKNAIIRGNKEISKYTKPKKETDK